MTRRSTILLVADQVDEISPRGRLSDRYREHIANGEREYAELLQRSLRSLHARPGQLA